MIRTHRLLAAGAIVFGLAAIAAGEPAPNGGRADLNGLASDVANERDHVSAITLATWIHDQRPGLHVIDVRDSAAYESLHIPGAVRMSVEDAAALDAPLDAPIVLYSEGGTHAAQVWFMLRARGFRRVYFLREGLYEWVSRVMTPRLATDATPKEIAEYESVLDLSRYFGGTPRRNVDRASIPDGYWLHDDPDHPNQPSTNDAHSSTNGDAGEHDAVINNLRQRGC